MVRRIKSGTYIHERAGWPGFRWDHARISARLVDVRHRQGRLIGRMEGLGFQLRAEAVLNTLTEDVLKSSEIEGEKLDRDQVRSSIARRLGLDIGGLTPADRDVEGVVEMMLDATQRYDEPADGAAPVRLARGSVPDRPQRNVEDQGRGLARRQDGPDAGGFGPDRQGAGPLRGARGRPRCATR